MARDWPCRGVRRAFRPAVEVLEGRLTPAVAFAAQQTFAAGYYPAAVATGDFNGDGKADFAVVNTRDNTAAVYLNTTPPGAAAATFAAPQTFAAGSSPASLAAADVNGDSKPDLVVASSNQTVSVLLNTTAAGSGTAAFVAQQTFSTGPFTAAPAAVAVGDLNGDNKPDLAVANGVVLAVLLNATAAGSNTAAFAAAQTFAAGTGPESVAVGDFNGDGKLDVALGNVGSFKNPETTVSVLLNQTAAGSGTAAFAAQQTFAVDGVPSWLAAADFNGDGKSDLAVTTVGNTVSVLLDTTATGAAPPSFAALRTFAVGNNGTAQQLANVAVGDFNGDGKPDLAVTDWENTAVSVLLDATPAGSGTAAFTNQQTFAAGLAPVAVAAADFNGDGKPDLVVANSGDIAQATAKAVSVLLNASVPAVVAQFGVDGVWRYNRTTGAWAQLTAANASRLVTNVAGEVVGVFHNEGVWTYTPAAGWQKINGVDATALALDASGDIVAQFPGYGVGEFVPGSGWRTLTAANAALLAMDATGNVAADFPGSGVWVFRPAGGGWQQINGTDATLLAVDDLGGVVADFRGVGVAEYQAATGWQVLNGNQATALAADGQGNVAAQFPGNGVGQYVPGVGWGLLTQANAALLAAADGDVFGGFGGAGVWQFDLVRRWIQLTAAGASALAVA